MALGLALPAAVQAVEFNTELLNNTNGSPVELKYFEQGNSVAPGSYGNPEKDFLIWQNPRTPIAELFDDETNDLRRCRVRR